MTATRLSDMIVPEEFNDYVVNLTIEKSDLIQSGLMTDMTAMIDDQIAGTTVNMPFLNDLTGTSEVIDDTVDLTVNNVTTGQDIAVKLLRGKAFGATDLAADLAGTDPVDLIANRFANWWALDQQTTLFNVLKGAMGAASMSANVLDISGLSGGAENFDAESFLDAEYLLGDHSAALSAIACHSATVKAMKKADLIDYVLPSEGGRPLPVYQGKRVIELDTGMAPAASIYTTYLFGAGAIGYGEKSPKHPVDVERDGLKGGGQEWIVQRRQFVMHPVGIKWVGTAAGPTPTNAELATTTNWTRVYNQKRIRIVAFKHKLG